MANSRLDAIEKMISEKDLPVYANSRQYRMFDPKYPEWTPKEGPNYINIIAPVEPDRYFGMTVFIHYNIGNEHFLCPRGVERKPCPVCEEYDKRKAQARRVNPDIRDRDLPRDVQELNATPRMIYMIVDTFDTSTIEKGIQIFPAAYKKIDAEGVRELCKKRRGQNEPKDVSDPEQRLDVTFTKGGKGLNTTYSGFAFVESQINAEEFYADRPERFEDILNVMDYEIIKKSLSEKLAVVDEGQQESEPERGIKREALKPEVAREPVKEDESHDVEETSAPSPSQQVRGLRTDVQRETPNEDVDEKQDKLSALRNKIRGEVNG
jgi:hypothetical protein